MTNDKLSPYGGRSLVSLKITKTNIAVNELQS